MKTIDLRTTLLSSILALAVGIAACTGGDDDDDDAASPSPSPSPSASPSPTNFALSFDGFDDYVAVPDAGGFDFGTTVTVEAWLKPLVYATNSITSAVGGATGTDTSPTGGSYSLNTGNNGAASFIVSVPATNNAGAAAVLSTSGWVHIAGTFDGSNIRFYKNGSLAATTAHAGNVSDVDVFLMGRLFANGGHYKGLIDEVRIWNVVRTDVQLTANMGVKLAGNEPGLVAYYDMDAGTGALLLDVTAASNDGRLGSTTSADANDPAWVASDVPVN